MLNCVTVVANHTAFSFLTHLEHTFVISVLQYYLSSLLVGDFAITRMVTVDLNRNQPIYRQN